MNAANKPLILRVGGQAYFDALFNPLVPCRVEKITRGENQVFRVDLLVTKTAGAYPKGHRISTSSRYAVPVRAVYLSGYQYFIKPYTVEYSTETVEGESP
jgi:hypothetical protein